MGYEYQFPRFSKKAVSIGSQIRKIEEEVNEVKMATDLREVIKETHNVIHACETLLHLCDQEEVQQGYQETIDDNEKRGYYR